MIWLTIVDVPPIVSSFSRVVSSVQVNAPFTPAAVPRIILPVPVLSKTYALVGSAGSTPNEKTSCNARGFPAAGGAPRSVRVAVALSGPEIRYRLEPGALPRWRKNTGLAPGGAATCTALTHRSQPPMAKHGPAGSFGPTVVHTPPLLVVTCKDHVGGVALSLVMTA